MRHPLVRLIAVVLLAWIATPGAQAPAPILILISFDGWRWDYLDRIDAPNLAALAARGVRSDGLVPVFPSLTFPNHYTVVTGLRPDRHGVVSNAMFDRTIGPEKFTMASATSRDARWWGGEPLWTTAIRQGRKSASMFWPGSEAIRPTYWHPYDGTVPNAARVEQVLTWLRLPDTDRPSFVTLYFSDVDSVGHRRGPTSPELAAAARGLDDLLGMLVAGIDGLGLRERTTIIVVSDHGMAETSSARMIYLSDYLAEGEAEVVEASHIVGLNPLGGLTAGALAAKLDGRHPALRAYPRERLPTSLRYGQNARVPAVVGLVEAGWTVAARRPAGLPPETPRLGGAHGYDPRYRDMHGLFVAAGPRLRQGVRAPIVENIHLYNLMCELLGLSPAANDGDWEAIGNLLTR